MSGPQQTILELQEELELIKTTTLAEERQLDADTKASEEADRNSFTAEKRQLYPMSSPGRRRS